jgi:hypothetical protein
LLTAAGVAVSVSNIVQQIEDVCACHDILLVESMVAFQSFANDLDMAQDPTLLC